MVEPGGIEPVCAGQEPWGGVEETCCSSRSDFWLRERLKTKKELVVV